MIRYGLTTLIFLLPINAHAGFVPPGLQPGDQYHLVFVSSFVSSVDSSQTIPTNFPAFGGLNAADWNLNFAAEQAGLLPGWNGADLIWKAILSSDTVNAIDRFDIQGPVYNMNGEIVAMNKADFWDGTHSATMKYDEYGASVSAANAGTWTGSGSTGTSSVGTCSDWSQQSGSGIIGNAGASGSTWALSATRACTLTARLYGISPLLTVVPEPSGFALAAIGLMGLMRRRRS